MNTEELFEEDLLLLKKKFKDVPSQQKIFDFLGSSGNVRSIRHCIKLRRAMNIAYGKKIEAYFHQMATTININPTRTDVKTFYRDLGVILSANKAKALLVELKSMYPQLWRDQPSQTFTCRMYGEDAALMETFLKMLGNKKSMAIPVMIRSLILASSRGEINLPSLLTQAMNLSDQEITRLYKAITVTIRDVK